MKFLNPIFSKSGLFGLTLVVSTSLTGGVLTGCTNGTTDTRANQDTTAQEQPHGGGMNHGDGMDHAMDLGPADAEYDLRFIDGMIPHHQGAVDMAKEAQEKSQRAEIQALSDEIISAQKTEIEQLKQWRQAWYPDAGDQPIAYHPQMGHSMEMTEEQRQSMMMTQDLGAADAEFDLRFINAMIPHHEGAIIMAEDVLAKSERPEIKQLAQEIIASQQQEIDQMKEWRQAWYQQ